MLSAMQFKTFVWPNNPKTLQFSYEKLTAIHKFPFGQYELEPLGPVCRILDGEGTFFGADAYQSFRALAQVFEDDSPGLLLHPLWQLGDACFTRLELLQEPGENLVRYRFRFAQLPRNSRAAAVTAAPQAYITQDDTLWAVAARTGQSVARLLSRNPSISNPNAAVQGSTVRL